RKVLETLREPLESGRIHIARAARQAEFPAEFQLIAAMNPCPCGFSGHRNGKCRCTPDQLARYRCPSAKLRRTFTKDSAILQTRIKTPWRHCATSFYPV
ncbi:MAG: ATP-binding protein, partial [Azonexus sp.]